MKLKRLPSMKDKKRYLFFSIISDYPIKYDEGKLAVNNSLENWLGDKDYALAKTRIIRNLWKSGGVIQCSHRFVDDVKVGLGLIHQIGDSKVIFHTTKVTGTIKSGQANS